MATRDIIVIGASAGGVQALLTLVADLPPNLPAAVFIVLHLSANAPSLLPEILARKCKLEVAHAIDGEPIMHRRVYIAPPDQHLIIENGSVRLVHGPKENLHRPSIDTLFRSAARWAGPRVIGVVLTGARDDGKVGMRAVQQRGGITIVQDPFEAPFPSMPMSVMRDIRVDYSLPLSEIAPLLNTLSREVAYEEERYPVPDDVEIGIENRGTTDGKRRAYCQCRSARENIEAHVSRLSRRSLGNKRRRHTALPLSRGSCFYLGGFERRTIRDAGGGALVCRPRS